MPRPVAEFSVDTIVFEEKGTATEGDVLTEYAVEKETGLQIDTDAINDGVTGAGPAEENRGGVSETSIVANKMQGTIVNWLPLAQMLWIMGVIAILLVNLLGIRRLQQRIKGGRVVTLKAKQRIVEIDSIDTPFLWGIFKPMIYLPVGMDEQEKSYIVAHECYHKYRKDCLTKILAFGVTVLHWFNPLVWVAYALFCRDMEISCDEAVLAGAERNINKQYAESLLKYAAKQSGYVITPLTFGESAVKIRIKNVLRFRKKGTLVSVLAFVLVFCVIVGLFVRPKKNGEEQINLQETGNAVTDNFISEDQRVPDISDSLNEQVGENISNSESTSVFDSYIVGQIVDPTEKQWELAEIRDVRQSFSQMSYIPETGTEDDTYLLAAEESYVLYGKGSYEAMLLACDGQYVEILCPYASNYMIPVEIEEADYDGDHVTELAIKLNVLHGTGVFVDTFFMADRTDSGELIVYQFLDDNYLGQLQEHISYEPRGEGIQAYVNEVTAGAVVEYTEEEMSAADVNVGEQIRFDLTGTNVTIQAELGFYADIRLRPVADYNGCAIVADLCYQDGGIFELMDFRIEMNANEMIEYKKTESLYAEGMDTTVLVKFDDKLFGKSFSIIDFATEGEPIGEINKLIEKDLVPQIDGETNAEELVGALVYVCETEDAILQYNGEYCLFERIE